MAMWNTYIWVESADETAKKVTEAGGSIVMEPFDVMDSGRMAVCMDPEGAAFCVWEAKEHRGSQIVNEHGSVNFNDLNTRDLDGAKEFYGAVFGWKWLDMGGGYGGWMLPGYGDHLEATVSPGMRAGMKEMGAPEGFEDVVATVGPIGDDQPDTPPHWSVTFAVDDADAAAQKATELGGKVLVRPHGCPVGADVRRRRPPGRDLHRQPVRSREQGPLARGRDQRGRLLTPGSRVTHRPGLREYPAPHGPGGPLYRDHRAPCDRGLDRPLRRQLHPL